MRRFVIVCAAVAGAVALSVAGNPESGRPAGLDQVAFLAGAWAGPMGADHVEEHWTAPRGTSVLGMFRWVRADGAPIVFEILTITKEGDDVLLRLRHLDAKLQPWPSEVTPVTLRLAEASDRRAVFRAIEDEKKLTAVTYECPTPDELRILVEFQNGREPLRFRLDRTGAK